MKLTLNFLMASLVLSICNPAFASKSEIGENSPSKVSSAKKCVDRSDVKKKKFNSDGVEVDEDGNPVDAKKAR